MILNNWVTASETLEIIVKVIESGRSKSPCAVMKNLNRIRKTRGAIEKVATP